MRRIQYTYTLIFALFFITSCEHHHLYHAWKDTVVVRINLDWSISELDGEFDGMDGYIRLNGVTAIAYHKATGRFYSEVTSPTTNYIDMTLPEGEFNILVFNNTEKDFASRAVFLEKHLKSAFRANIVDSDTESRVTRSGDKPIVANALRPKARAVVEDVLITKEDIEIFYNKPDISEDQIIFEYNARPVPAVEGIVIHSKIKGLKYAILPPSAQVGFTSQARYLYDNYACKQLESSVVKEFPYNNRWFDPASENVNGTLTHRFVSFGLFDDVSHTYNLNVKTQLLNGDIFEVNVPIHREDIVWKRDEGLGIDSKGDGYFKHHIIVEFELPEVIGEGNEGPFDPEAEDWNDVDIPVDF